MSLQSLMLDSIRNPQKAVADLRRLDLSMEARWMGFGLVVIGLALIMAVLVKMMPQSGAPLPPPVEMVFQSAQSPFRLAGIFALSILMVIAAIVWIGRLFGGQGSFGDGLLLISWVYFLLLVAQVAETVLMLLFPLVAAVFSLASLLLTPYLLVRFTQELHGFNNAFKVALGMAGVIFGFATIFGGFMG